MSVACILFVEEAVLITTRCKTLGFITVITKDYQTHSSVCGVRSLVVQNHRITIVLAAARRPELRFPMWFHKTSYIYFSSFFLHGTCHIRFKYVD